MAKTVFDRFGACHLLFNNAGVTSGGGGLPWEQEPNDWKWCFGVNVFGVANGVLAFVPRMIDSGEPGIVVNTSSGDGGIALDVPLNIHSGSGIPDFGELDAARAIMLIELPWFAHRPLWHLIFGGVLDRHPRLRMALTEQGIAWLPRGIDTLEWFFARMTRGGSAEASFFGASVGALKLTPREYFARNVWAAASFLRPSEAPLVPEIGVDRVMWGADYPHSEGSYPYTSEALRVAFASFDPADVRAMVDTNAASFFGFDLDRLRPIGDRIGPDVDEVCRSLPVEEYPADSTCNAFERELAIKSW